MFFLILIFLVLVYSRQLLDR